MNPPLVLLKGTDPVLLNDRAVAMLDTLVGDRDRNEIVDHFTGDEFELAEAVLAASAMSMFGERIIVIRQGGRFGSSPRAGARPRADDGDATVDADGDDEGDAPSGRDEPIDDGRDHLAPLLAYLADPNPSSTILLVWDKPVTMGSGARPVPKKLVDAVKAAGGTVTDCDVPGAAKIRQGWLDDHLANAGVKFLPPTKKFVAERLGEDVARLPGLIRLLESSFEPGTKLSPDDVAPFLTTAGSVPPWDLTDAIDRGDVSGAVTTVRRMVGAGGRHPLQVMATLTSHFTRMLRLDGAGVRSEQDAAALLGMKGSTYPAKKAMEQGRKLGSQRIAESIRVLARADVDLRGATAVPADAVLEVLVARLARLSSSRGRR